jgi:hypothetical protein
MRKSDKIKFRLSRKDWISITVIAILTGVAAYVIVNFVFCKTMFWKAVAVF